MIDFLELVKKRFSVRNYDPLRMVPEKELNVILEAGRLAPSAANRQPWKFWVVQSSEMLEKVRNCYPGEWLKKAPQILIVTGDRKSAWVRKSDSYNAIETDLTIAMTHMVLAAASIGVATCWIAAFNPLELRKVLGLSGDEDVYALTPLGYSAEGVLPGVKERKAFDEVVRFI